MSGAVEGVALVIRDHMPLQWLDDALRAEAFITGLATALNTPPARSYADGVEDAAKLADASAETCVPLMNGLGLSASVETGRYRAATEIAAVIRLLSQDTNEGNRP
jgi:hypothetical protein